MYFKKNGFTLVELIVAMSIVGIVSVIAFPSFKSSNINNRLNSETNQLVNIFSLARNEAYRRNSFVSICATNNSTLCNSTDFSTGIIIYSDPSNSGLNNTSQIIKVYDKWQSNDKGKITVSDGSSIYTFNAIPSPVASGSVLVCYAGFNSYSININSIGGIKVTNNTGDSGC